MAYILPVVGEKLSSTIAGILISVVVCGCTKARTDVMRECWQGSPKLDLRASRHAGADDAPRSGASRASSSLTTARNGLRTQPSPGQRITRSSGTISRRQSRCRTAMSNPSTVNARRAVEREPVLGPGHARSAICYLVNDYNTSDRTGRLDSRSGSLCRDHHRNRLQRCAR